MKPCSAAVSSPILVVAALFSVLLSTPGLAQQSITAAASQNSASSVVSSPEDSPAQQRITAAKRQIAKDPKKVSSFNDLAIAYLRRARETANPAYFQDAEQALAQGLRLDSGDFPLQKTQVALMLGRQQDVKAREMAAQLNRRTPDDVMTYGYLAEADITLGNYPEAETSAQWMLNMLPNNVPGLLLAATLRELYGDADGALEALNVAYSETSPTEVEDLAWIANRMAAVQIEAGRSDAAALTLARAEELYPRYPYTMENLARVRFAQHRAGDAVTLLAQATKIDADPDVLYELANAQAAAGDAAGSRATNEEFERLATGPGASDAARLDLILLESRTRETAPRALFLARQEMNTRHGVWMLDAFAWALEANGQSQEADAAIQKAIAVGIQSSKIFYHAGYIAQKLNRSADADRDFDLAIRANPSSEEAADARRALGQPAAEAREARRDAEAAPIPLTAGETPGIGISAQPAPHDIDTVSATPAAAALPTKSAATFAPVAPALLTPRATDTERLIHNAQAKVAHNPKDAEQLAGLGAAYFQRARETGDVSDYQLAEEALTKSLDLVSADFSADPALQTMAEVCMGEHRFADALSYSQKALSLGSGDVSPFAIVGDSYTDMGDYSKAGAAYSRLSVTDGERTSPRTAYARESRLSYLKFITGDTPGAVRLMKDAVTEGTEAQLPAENLAWLYYELGEYYTLAGDVAPADAAYLAALSIHPGDYRALAALGKLRGAQGRYAEAITLYQKAIAVVPMPIFVAELGDLYVRSGKQSEAQKQYQLVEYIGLLGHINQVLHNRDLALFYADHDMKLSEALDLAQKEFEVRHDIYTWDALAWALYKNGKYAEARHASDQALQFGTRDPLLLFHAGMIAGKLGQRDLARREFKEALAINPRFHLIYAGVAQQQLTLLDAHATSAQASSRTGGEPYGH